jgi:hypothetical protein
MLGVDRDGFAAGEFVQIDAMAAAVKSNLDAVMDQRFALEARSEARGDEQIDGALFEHSRAHALFDIFAAVALDDHGFDALQVEKMGEQESRRARSHDSNLRAQRAPPEVSAALELSAV